MLGDFLDLASMTSWLELLILIVELTMERSFSTGQASPLSPFLHQGRLWPRICRGAHLSRLGGGFRGPSWLASGWMLACGSYRAGGTVGDYSAEPRRPSQFFPNLQRTTFVAGKWLVVCFREYRPVEETVVTSEVCLAEITFSPCSLRVVILSHPALEVTVYQGSALGCIQVKTHLFLLSPN